MTVPPWKLALLVALVTVGALAAGVDGGFVWDDDANLVRNQRWRGFGGEQLAWMWNATHLGHWQPLTWLSFAVDHAVWGMDARGYRATNLLLHAIGAVLLFLVARRLSGDDAAAVFAALVWAVHPLRVESVTWITERRDVLSAGLLLLSCYAYLRAVDDARWWLLVVPAYVLSLGAKAWGVTLPVVLLLLDVFLRRGWSKRVVGEKLGLLALALPVMHFARLAQQSAGAMSTWGGHPFEHRVAQAVYGVAWYPKATLLPIGLSPLYELEPTILPLTAPYIGSLVAALAITGVAVVLWRRGMRGPLIAWLTYLVLVSPVLGLFQSGLQKVADRYAHLSTIPFALLVGALLARRRALGVIAIAVLAMLTAMQTRHWQDERALWDRVLAIDPGSPYGQHNAGLLAQREERTEDAIAHLTRAIELADHLPRSYVARAMVHLDARKPFLARRDADLALQRAPDDPSAHFYRGMASRAIGNHRAALRHLERATELSPDSWRVWGAYGETLAKLGRTADARAALERAVGLAPASVRAKIAERLRALGD